MITTCPKCDEPLATINVVSELEPDFAFICPNCKLTFPKDMCEACILHKVMHNYCGFACLKAALVQELNADNFKVEWFGEL